MKNDYIKNLNIFIIQKKYKLLNKFIYNFQNYIIFLNNNNILTLYNKNIILGEVYELIKYFNNEYNILITNKNIDRIKILDIIIKKYNIKNYDYNIFYEYILDLNNVINDNHLNVIINPLNNIKIKIMNLIKDHGSNNIISILELLEIKYLKIYNNYTIDFINLLNDISFITKFNIKKKKFIKKI